MYLWRKRASPQWWKAHEEVLRSRFENNIAVIEQPNRKRLEIEIVCKSRNALKKFGGRAEKLPRDWLQRYQRQLKRTPIKVGKRKLIIPAGAAFGTGEHATTAMSLRILERVVRIQLRSPQFVADLGTGSGILALAARCLGAKRAVGIDIDPIAIRTAKENARRNKIDKVTFQAADVRRWKFPRQVDIVTANLFSELLISILPRLKRSRWLILSGVLREQEGELLRALERNQLEVVDTGRRGKWIAILARRLRRP